MTVIVNKLNVPRVVTQRSWKKYNSILVGSLLASSSESDIKSIELKCLTVGTHRLKKAKM